jgi:hypothetical protein
LKSTTTQPASEPVQLPLSGEIRFGTRVLQFARDGRKLERVLGVVLWLALIAVLLGTGR